MSTEKKDSKFARVVGVVRRFRERHPEETVEQAISACCYVVEYAGFTPQEIMDALAEGGSK